MKQILAFMALFMAFVYAESSKFDKAFREQYSADVETCNNTLLEERETAPACVRTFKRNIELCNSGNNFACGELGRGYYIGIGTKKNVSKGFDLAKKLCDKGNYDICDLVAAHYNYTIENKSNGFKYAKITCENATINDVKGGACAMVGAAYELGTAVVQDKYKALEYYKIACDLAMICQLYNRLKQELDRKAQYGF